MTTQQDGWLTLRDAAHKLGVSDLTIRRRIKDGRLAHRLAQGKYYVHLELEPPGREVEQTAVNNAQSADDQVREYADDQSTELSAEAVGRPQGPLAGGKQETQGVPQPAPTGAASMSVDLSSVLPEYTRLAEQSGRAGLLEEQLRALEERCASLESGTVTLAARNGWLESKLEERDREVQLLTDSQYRPPWWRRLFGGRS